MNTLLTTPELSAIKGYYEAADDILYNLAYKMLRSTPQDDITRAVVLHEDKYFTHPGLKQNMVLTHISVGGDKDSVMLYFTDTMLGVEDWKYAMQDVQPRELISLLETLEEVKA